MKATGLKNIPAFRKAEIKPKHNNLLEFNLTSHFKSDFNLTEEAEKELRQANILDVSLPAANGGGR